MQIVIALGVLLLFPILCFVYSVVGIKKSPSKWKKYLPFYIYFVFIAAYSYTPPAYSNVDLLRYFRIVESLKGLHLSEAIDILADNLYFENFLFWLIAQTNMPRLLPAVTTATVFGIGGYTACDLAQIEDYKYMYKVLIIQMIMIPFFSVVANIRNVFAFSLVILASYIDLYKHKRNIGVLLLYVIPIFMHKTGIVILVIRIMMPLFKRAYAAALLLFFGLSGLITFAYTHISAFTFGGAVGNIVKKLINSSYSYLLGESEYAERVRNSLGAAVTRYLVFAFLILLLIFYLKKFWKNKNISDIDMMGYLLCVVSLSCNVFDTPAYWRFAAAFCILIPSILYSFFRDELTSKVQRQWISYGLTLYLILRVALILYRSSVDWIESVSLFAFTNLYTLIIMFCKSLFIY